MKSMKNPDEDEIYDEEQKLLDAQNKSIKKPLMRWLRR